MNSNLKQLPVVGLPSVSIKMILVKCDCSPFFPHVGTRFVWEDRVSCLEKILLKTVSRGTGLLVAGAYVFNNCLLMLLLYIPVYLMIVTREF